MSRVRAWQTVEAIAAGERRVISSLELDLSHSPGESPIRLRYVPFAASNRLKVMADFAQRMSQFGPQAPDPRSLLLICRKDQHSHFSDRYPQASFLTFHGATIVSADVAEVELIRQAVINKSLVIDQKRPVPVGDSNAGGSLLSDMLAQLWWEGRLLYHPPGKDDFRRTTKEFSNRIDLVVPFSPHTDRLSRASLELGAIAAFNGGYYIFVDEEFDDPFSFANDHIGLVITDGRVINAPLFARTALIVSHRLRRLPSDEAVYSLGCALPTIRQVSLANYAIRLPGDVVVYGERVDCRRVMDYFGRVYWDRIPADLNPLEHPSANAAFYNRLVNRVVTGVTQAFTPPSSERLELVVVGEHVCAIKEGGETYIPRNGFVVSMPMNAAAERIARQVLCCRDNRVEHAIDFGDDIIHAEFAVQVSCPIIRQGVPLDIAAHAARGFEGFEEYVPRNVRSGESGIPPLFQKPRSVVNRRGRIAFGIRPDHRCYVVMVEGCEPRTRFPDFDSFGGSVMEVIDFMLRLGCREAVLLDGGGSAQILYEGRALVKVDDRNDIPFAPVERLIPGGWIVTE